MHHIHQDDSVNEVFSPIHLRDSLIKMSRKPRRLHHLIRFFTKEDGFLPDNILNRRPTTLDSSQTGGFLSKKRMQ